MSAFVVDTNVPVVANGRCEQANPDCVLACIDALEQIKKGEVVVIDDALLILTEYMQNLSLAGQPGAGDAFMKWVWSVQADSQHCECVTITPDEVTGWDFLEFPNDNNLARFDRSDRKFVAAAVASTRHPIILNAVDSDWAEHQATLGRNGITVTFLCPQHVCPR